MDVRKPPSFLQISSGQLRKQLFLPFSFYRHLAQMKTLALKESNPASFVSGYGAFEEPHYDVLGAMELVDVELFQSQIAACIWEAYDVEWWFIVKERAYHRKRNTRWLGFPNVELALGSFPRTENGYAVWRALQLAQPLLAHSSKLENGKVEIADIGKWTYWCTHRFLPDRPHLTFLFLCRPLSLCTFPPFPDLCFQFVNREMKYMFCCDFFTHHFLICVSIL
jgi:hypothetical protein